MDFDQTLLALGTAPIPGDAPTGQPARYEPEFESLQAEIDKLAGLSGMAPDWNQAIAYASTLLATKSKDLLVACYLCAALREVRGWSGLADGFNVIKALMTAFWEGLQPERLRARKTAIDWILDRCNAQVGEAPVQDSDRAAMLACVTLIDELVAFGESRWEGDAPTLWALSKTIKGRIPAEPPEAPAASSSPADDTSSPRSGAGGQQAAASLGTGASRADAYRAITAAAEQLQAAEPHSPVPYLLRRAVAWGAMPLPALYAELQRAGTVWDLVLQAPPPGEAASGASSIPASPISTSPPPAADIAPSPARRGDY